MKTSISLALILAATPCLADTPAGLIRLQDTSVAERPLSLSVWYPSEEQERGTIGGNAVFEGVPAALDASVPEGELPMVVVSHGGLRSATNSGAWLSSSIAQAGYVVVEVNAPRPANATTALDEIWQRPEDIRRAVDLVLADATWGVRVDASRVAVAGFALGGTAALSVAGAQLDTERYTQSCAAGRSVEAPDCGWYAAQGVELSDTSAEGLEGLAPDLRVSSVIAMNPEYPAVLGPVPANVSALQISLGDPAEASGNGEIPKTIVIPEASAFDAFAVCTAAGPDILSEDGGDPSLCGASAEARRSVHREISDVIVSFLDGLQD